MGSQNSKVTPPDLSPSTSQKFDEKNVATDSPSAHVDKTGIKTSTINDSAPKATAKKKVKTSELSTPELAMIKCRNEKKLVSECYSKWFTGRFLGFAQDDLQQAFREGDGSAHVGREQVSAGSHATQTSSEQTVIPDRDECDDLAEVYQSCFLRHVKKYQEKRGIKAKPESLVGSFEDDEVAGSNNDRT